MLNPKNEINIGPTPALAAYWQFNNLTAVLFIDISGFSGLIDALMQHGHTYHLAATLLF